MDPSNPSNHRSWSHSYLIRGGHGFEQHSIPNEPFNTVEYEAQTTPDQFLHAPTAQNPNYLSPSCNAGTYSPRQWSPTPAPFPGDVVYDAGSSIGDSQLGSPMNSAIHSWPEGGSSEYVPEFVHDDAVLSRCQSVETTFSNIAGLQGSGNQLAENRLGHSFQYTLGGENGSPMSSQTSYPPDIVPADLQGQPDQDEQIWSPATSGIRYSDPSTTPYEHNIFPTESTARSASLSPSCVTNQQPVAVTPGQIHGTNRTALVHRVRRAVTPVSARISNKSKGGKRCSDCDIIIAPTTKLSDHRKSHSNERPYSCNFNNCGKSFKQAKVLERHEKTHKKTTDYLCCICELPLGRKDNCKRHIRNKHPQYTVEPFDGRKRYGCPRCSETFAVAESCEHHIQDKHPDAASTPKDLLKDYAQEAHARNSMFSP